MNTTGTIEREFVSQLDAAPKDVWRRATSLEGINHELMPYASMHSIDGFESLQDVQTQHGDRVLDVNISAFGIVPIKRVAIRMVELDNFGFVEESNQPGMRSWRHERRVQSDGDGARVTDLLRFRPTLLGGLTTKVIETLFRHRHQRLCQHWNSGGIS